jgi:ribosome modulation factor
MRNAPNNGREANERGFYLHECPLFNDPSKRDQWVSDWNDAQIDREIWEDANHERAIG